MTAKRQKNILKNIVIAVLLCLLCVISMQSFPIAKAEGTKTTYSNVLEDLQKDELFKSESYPAKASDYSVNVIQIAESENNELFVYTYEPSREDKELNATSINISTAINDSLKYKNYKLRLLSAQGVFGKYLVEDFTVLSDALRYYDISTIYRTWDSEIDGEITGGTGSEKACTVAKVYSAATVGETVSYVCKTTEIIEIRPEYRFDGFIRYDDGIYWNGLSYCDSYFIAFNADRKIDDLMEADVSWKYRTYMYRIWVDIMGGGNETTYGDTLSESITLKAEDEAGNAANGWFAKKRTWKKIQTVSDFIATENLTDETKTALNGKQWVLRFAEYGYTLRSYGSESRDEGTQVSDVTILRLMFETDGVIYNLGVVSDKVTPDDKPDGGDVIKKPGCAGFDIKDLWKYILLGIAIIAVIALIIAFFPHVINLVIWLAQKFVKLLLTVLKGLWIIISAPFRVIAALIRKGKDK